MKKEGEIEAIYMELVMFRPYTWIAQAILSEHRFP